MKTIRERNNFNIKIFYAWFCQNLLKSIINQLLLAENLNLNWRFNKQNFETVLYTLFRISLALQTKAMQFIFSQFSMCYKNAKYLNPFVAKKHFQNELIIYLPSLPHKQWTFPFFDSGCEAQWSSSNCKVFMPGHMRNKKLHCSKEHKSACVSFKNCVIPNETFYLANVSRY